MLKRGRAEEEIARIRGSSFDPSPTKGHMASKKICLDNDPPSSSPLRGGSAIGLMPLTPGLSLYPPTRGPPTVSPGTHLRRHRESIRDLIGTPAPKDILTADDIKFTPSFIFAEGNAFSPQFSPLRTTAKSSPLKHLTSVEEENDENIDRDDEQDACEFAHILGEDSDEVGDTTSLDNFFANGSPMAKKSSRPSSHRQSTSLGALQALGAGKRNRRLGSPIRLSPPKGKTTDGASPAKKAELPKIDVFLGAVDSSDDDGAKSALDLTKGFRTIGAMSGKENEPTFGGSPLRTKSKPKSKVKRPPLGKSSTNLT